MKIRLFTIPNLLTLSNLICGSIALIEILLNQSFVSAFILIIAAATFDFLDGFAARLLGQYSEIGLQLDSLADLVSFGLVPAMAMYTLFNIAEKSITHPLWVEWGGYISFIIVCFSALRLARFNIDTEQRDSFIGLPTPASALFCLSIGALSESGEWVIGGEWVALISIVIALLLVAPVKLIALKFNSLAWSKNRVRYIFLIVAIATLIALRSVAVPIIVVIYIVISLLSNYTCPGKANKLN